jgi:GNAT superfamily N-acetyltransferase
MKLIPKLITAQNMDVAIALADTCFHTDDERSHFRDTYNRLATGQTVYQDDEMGCAMHLLPYFLYYASENVVGTTGLYVCDGNTDRLWLGWFGIHPSRRGTGVGSEMLTQISKLAHLYGAKELALYTSEHEDIERVKHFYEKNGFRTLGTPHHYRAARVFKYVKTLG